MSFERFASWCCCSSSLAGSTKAITFLRRACEHFDSHPKKGCVVRAIDDGRPALSCARQIALPISYKLWPLRHISTDLLNVTSITR
jgi:hypothetical protein